MNGKSLRNDYNVFDLQLLLQQWGSNIRRSVSFGSRSLMK